MEGDFPICAMVFGEASTDDIHHWLDHNTDDNNFLKQAVNYKHNTGNAPLHFLVSAEHPYDLVKTLLQLEPDKL